MGVCYSTVVIFGVPFKSIAYEKVEDVSTTKYNPDTGEPYILGSKKYSYHLKGVKDPFDNFEEIVSFLEQYIDVFNPNPMDYDNNDAIVGHVPKTNNQVSYDSESLVSNLNKAENKICRLLGIPNEEVCAEMYIFNHEC